MHLHDGGLLSVNLLTSDMASSPSLSSSTIDGAVTTG